MSTCKKLKIGVFTKPLDNWKSGSGHHLDELLKTVLDQNDSLGNPFQFVFFHYKKSDNPIYSRVKEVILPRFPLAAVPIIRSFKLDLVHYAPLTILSPVFGVGSKKTATVHGIEEELYPQGYTLIQRLHARYILPPYMRLMDGIATVSQTSKDYFVSNYGCKAESICITTNGMADAYRVLDGIVREKKVVHISRYSARKNPHAIIDGFARFLKSRTVDRDQWKLVCAGKGWNDEEALLIAKEAGIEKYYEAPGFISQDEAVTLLNSASVFVFPSFAEGFGMPNIEAMACGTPVITSGIFAIPEIVQDAALILRSPENADELGLLIAKIVDDPDLRESLVGRGLKRCKDFRWENSARSLIDLWLQMLQ